MQHLLVIPIMKLRLGEELYKYVCFRSHPKCFIYNMLFVCCVEYEINMFKLNSDWTDGDGAGMAAGRTCGGWRASVASATCLTSLSGNPWRPAGSSLP